MTESEDVNKGAKFGEDEFKEYERVLPENCVEYMLFVVDADQQSKQFTSSLEAVRKAAVQLANQLTKDYIWQRHAFNLETKTDQGLHYLYGITDYGDSIEDEWLIVYILRELTKQFPGLWVRVSDSDGEFLLVEAANVLPKWLSPENDANRAWIHDGQLQIVPLKSDGKRQSKKITLPEAVGTLQSAADSLVHSTFVEAEAFYRLEKYPDQIQESIHYSMVTIPRRLAYVLHEIPKSISPAVEAFYLRDPIAMKPMLSASTERLIFPPKDLVDVSVKFTKVLYAQLKSQVFSPPPAWQDIFTSSEKQAASAGSSADSQRTHSMLELGMKVTCGFEMLAVGAAKSKNRTAREVALLLEDLAEDGDPVLPTDADIAAWKESARDDDDSWMDINFEDFQKELDGKRSASKEKSFGNANAQADLRKIVSRFEAFLNDERAGIDGAEFDEMDEDDEDDDDDSDIEDGSDSEDRDVSFDEEEFARMMREMMGMPADPIQGTQKGKEKMPEQASNKLEEDSEDGEIKKLSEQMEAELNGHGALGLDPKPKEHKAIKGRGKEQAAEFSKEADLDNMEEDSSDDDEVDIDYNLAKNLLESFKSQAGMVGPVGTMLADMGLQLPRDESEEDEDNK
ncbi:hypothetical protein VM1G_07928 [Cytospora mali]|uniref:Protein SGT1 n=1 Tax=Cytospora mali TaxID=578113 RepID=A0A194W7H1_CYTMA|nr:hypothetical protein VM1G_07928 [Valsa mali]